MVFKFCPLSLIWHLLLIILVCTPMSHLGFSVKRYYQNAYTLHCLPLRLIHVLLKINHYHCLAVNSAYMTSEFLGQMNVSPFSMHLPKNLLTHFPNRISDHVSMHPFRQVFLLDQQQFRCQSGQYELKIFSAISPCNPHKCAGEHVFVYQSFWANKPPSISLEPKNPNRLPSHLYFSFFALLP